MRITIAYSHLLRITILRLLSAFASVLHILLLPLILMKTATNAVVPDSATHTRFLPFAFHFPFASLLVFIYPALARIPKRWRFYGGIFLVIQFSACSNFLLRRCLWRRPGGKTTCLPCSVPLLS